MSAKYCIGDLSFFYEILDVFHQNSYLLVTLWRNSIMIETLQKTRNEFVILCIVSLFKVRVLYCHTLKIYHNGLSES